MKLTIDTENLTVSLETGNRPITIAELEFLHTAYDVMFEELKLEFEYQAVKSDVEVETKLNIFDGEKEKVPVNR